MRLLDTINAVQCGALKLANKTAEGLDSVKCAMDSVVERVDTVGCDLDSVTNALKEIGTTIDSTYKMIEEIPAISAGEWIMASVTLCAVFASIGITIWQTKKHNKEIIATQTNHNTEVEVERRRHDEEVAAERENHQKEVSEERELRNEEKRQTNLRHFREVDLSRAEKEFDEVKSVGNAAYDSVGINYILDVYEKCHEERNYAIYENEIKKLKRIYSTAMHELDMTLITYHLPKTVTYREEGMAEDITVNIDDQYKILYDYLMHFQKLMYFLEKVQSQEDITTPRIQYVDEKSPIVIDTEDIIYSFMSYCSIKNNNIFEIKEGIREYMAPIIEQMMVQNHKFGMYISKILDSELAKRDEAYEALKEASEGR